MKRIENRYYILIATLLTLISCNKKETEMSEIDIAFKNKVMLFTKNKKPFTGVIIEYYDNKKIKVKMNVSNGVKDGNLKQYYKNGKLQTYSTFDKGKLFGKFTSYYENGNERIVTYYNNDLRNGSFEEFFENQKLKLCGNYFNSLKIGQFEEYFKSGGKAIYNY